MLNNIKATTYELLLTLNAFFPLMIGLILVFVLPKVDNPLIYFEEVGKLLSIFPTFPYIIGIALPLAKKNFLDKNKVDIFKPSVIGFILYALFLTIVLTLELLELGEYPFVLAGILLLNMLVFNTIPYFIVKKLTKNSSIVIEKRFFIKGLLFAFLFNFTIFFISLIFESNLVVVFLLLSLNIFLQIILVKHWMTQYVYKK